MDSENPYMMDFPILQDSPSQVRELVKKEFCFAIGIGDPKVRKDVFNRNPKLIYPNLIHPSTTFGYKQKNSIESHKGNIITAGCRITNGCFFGDFVILNLNCTIGHDCIIDDFSSIMPGVNISGNVKLCENSYIGTGASIIHGGKDNKLVVGENCIVGSGAVVTKDTPKNSIMVGVPAKPLSKVQK